MNRMRQYGYPVLGSLHPRTRSKAIQFGIDLDRPGFHFVEPLGFADFICLEQKAFCVLTDSGTVQEETYILRVPSVTIRDVTEHAETVECRSNVLAGCDSENILKAVNPVTSNPLNWQIPPEYLAPGVANIVTRIMTSSATP
jgi:UDP-N-acetylglucosamine 2-epimerase (non-hydrolysing)